jgi:hypothetical protein
MMRESESDRWARNAEGVAKLARMGLPVEYDPAFLRQEDATRAFGELLREIAFPVESKIRMAGRDWVIPRLQCAFGDPGTAYRFCGVEVRAHPWAEAPALSPLRDRVAARVRPGTSVNPLVRRGRRNSLTPCVHASGGGGFVKSECLVRMGACRR